MFLFTHTYARPHSQKTNPYIAFLDKGGARSVWVISFPVSLGIYEIAIAGSREATDNLRNRSGK